MSEIRHRVTNVMILVNLGIASTYAFTPPVRGARRALVVEFIERLGPIWIVLFATSGVFLLAARVMKRGLVVAHTYSLSVSVFYSGALWASIVIREPFAFSIAAWASLAVATAHYAMSRWYASGGPS